MLAHRGGVRSLKLTTRTALNRGKLDLRYRMFLERNSNDRVNAINSVEKPFFLVVSFFEVYTGQKCKVTGSAAARKVTRSCFAGFQGLVGTPPILPLFPLHADLVPVVVYFLFVFTFPCAAARSTGQARRKSGLGCVVTT